VSIRVRPGRRGPGTRPRLPGPALRPEPGRTSCALVAARNRPPVLFIAARRKGRTDTESGPRVLIHVLRNDRQTKRGTPVTSRNQRETSLKGAGNACPAIAVTNTLGLAGRSQPGEPNAPPSVPRQLERLLLESQVSAEHASMAKISCRTRRVRPCPRHERAFSGQGGDGYLCKLTYCSSHRARAGRAA
jgi:hypothetical protein